MTAYRVIEDDLGGADIAALVTYHLAEMHKYSPPESVHALPLEQLRAPDVTFYSAWDGDTLAAFGALRALGSGRGELKSMRAAPAYRGKGAGEAILLHLIAEARRRGYHWLGLETGLPEPFLPARSLYAKHGFSECPPFADYVADGFSTCMCREL